MRDKILAEAKRIILECVDLKRFFDFRTGYANKQRYISLYKKGTDERTPYIVLSNLDKDYKLEIHGNVSNLDKDYKLEIHGNVSSYDIILTIAEFTEMSFYFNKLQKISEDLLLKELEDFKIVPDQSVLDSDIEI